ncbi:protein kinase domain-containing protein [Haliangium ochraceum]|uniref:Serine/threonine protein kinase n=1 Tax=Haliangium ochraceum (strain DSM 14365 / JCM 11303 / SMP-2) TaxID=502025 RepID=D0LX30_HALO1|nr:protein kinase [Haliangium ochraceum]ACY16072.1 serine/threonine protein kinase [Haliangium ochraceum DSM 14365]
MRDDSSDSVDLAVDEDGEPLTQAARPSTKGVSTHGRAASEAERTAASEARAGDARDGAGGDGDASAEDDAGKPGDDQDAGAAAAGKLPDAYSTSLSEPDHDHDDVSQATALTITTAPPARISSGSQRTAVGLPTLPSARFTPGTLLAERYRIIHLLGRGGMGEVYRAEDLKLEQPVALKFLPISVERDPDRLARFLEEVKIARAIAHPNICRVYDVGESESQHFLSMEYIEGENLTTLLRRIGRLPRAKAMELGQQICHGLAAVHAQGVLHRDLKPANLMIDDRGRAKITDFGLASLSETVEAHNITDGTPAYMAPEQLAGESVSVHSDLYALGLVLYQMFTGRPAFPGLSSRDQMMQRLETRIEPPSRLVPDIDPMVESAILRCLEADPHDRPGDALEVAAALTSSSVPAADAVLKAILVCRPGERSAWSEALGDDQAAALARSLAKRSRALMADYDGLALAGTGGQQMIFDRPVHAVRFALAYHQMFAELARELSAEVHAAVGIHLGEVTFRHDSVRAGTAPALYPNVDVGARDTAVRLAALAAPRQTLLTRSAFDLARQSMIDSVEGVRWLAHGSYEIEGLSEAADLFEVGVEGQAPLRAPAESPRGRPQIVQRTVAGWRPAPGLEMPQRYHWVIEKKLSEGGFGEVWLARHRKTREPRVFKFCYDATSLRALQREIALFRLLKETLGERSDINRIFDWNFEDAPYFIESAYTSGGDLIAWAAQQGGLEEVPLATRLEIVAQVATALAAAHSVGVLHKDVKPANVLMSSAERDDVQIKLADFGIGHVTETQRLAEAGITMVGLTEFYEDTQPFAGEGGTRLYMAPEVIEGKPATVRADVYALGVMLYQMVVGDFSRALAPGWERDVSDPILRGDIAAAVDGSEQQRLGDALRLAERLRTIERRREKRAADMRQAADARQAKLTLARVRRRRKVVGLLLVVVLLFSGTVFLQSRREAREARAAEQVSQFLVELFEVADPYKKEGAAITARQILDRGAARIETELSDQPAIRARLMHLMGTVYGNLGLYEDAQRLLEQALAIRKRLHGLNHLDVAETHHALGMVYLDELQFEDAKTRFEQALSIRRSVLGNEHLAVAESLDGLAKVFNSLRRPDDAEPLALQALEVRRALLPEDDPDIAASLMTLGTARMLQGRRNPSSYREAETYLREAIDMYRARLGDQALEVAEAMHMLAKIVLNGRGDRQEAEALLQQSIDIKRKLLGEQHISVAHSLSYQAEIARRTGDLARAESLFVNALLIYRASVEREGLPTANLLQSLARIALARGDDARAAKLANEGITIVSGNGLGEHAVLLDLLSDLGQALQMQGRAAEAEPYVRQAVAIGERQELAALELAALRADLVDILLEQGQRDAAAGLIPGLEAALAARSGDPDSDVNAQRRYHIASVVGSYHAGQGDDNAGEQAMLDALAGLRGVHVDDRGRRRAALRRLARFYANSGRHEKAELYRRLLRDDSPAATR